MIIVKTFICMVMGWGLKLLHEEILVGEQYFRLNYSYYDIIALYFFSTIRFLLILSYSVTLLPLVTTVFIRDKMKVLFGFISSTDNTKLVWDISVNLRYCIISDWFLSIKLKLISNSYGVLITDVGDRCVFFTEWYKTGSRVAPNMIWVETPECPGQKLLGGIYFSNTYDILTNTAYAKNEDIFPNYVINRNNIFRMIYLHLLTPFHCYYGMTLTKTLWDFLYFDITQDDSLESDYFIRVFDALFGKQKLMIDEGSVGIDLYFDNQFRKKNIDYYLDYIVDNNLTRKKLNIFSNNVKMAIELENKLRGMGYLVCVYYYFTDLVEDTAFNLSDNSSKSISSYSERPLDLYETQQKLLRLASCEIVISFGSRYGILAKRINKLIHDKNK